MANQALLQKKNGKYLWFSLLGLGFQPESATSSIAGKTSTKHINLGPNMFDKPNKDAFYIVSHFLLTKLNPTRFHEAYRYCWPVGSSKEDAEFRKVTCAWLRELMDETANAASKVVASLFLSPGGPKFTSLMLQLACHVMLQEMKTFTTDDNWVPEAAGTPAPSLEVAVKRLQLIKSRFLKAAVQQDNFLQEYQRRAQVLVKSVRDLRADSAKYNELLKRNSDDSTADGRSLPAKTKVVRSLWSTIDAMLSSVKEDQEALESVLKGAVDQYTLDGKGRVLKLPRSLKERIEQLPHQLNSGNVYEAGQLNLLCVLELMNHTLQLLKEERHRVSDAAKPELNVLNLQEKCHQMARVLQDLHFLREKISKEDIPEVKSGIRELTAQWDRKWMDTLKDSPLVSFLNEDPAFGFLSPMVKLSFELPAEESFGSSVFSQYPAKLPERSSHCKLQESFQHSIRNIQSYSSCLPATDNKRQNTAVSTDASARVNTSLDWLLDTPPSPHKTPVSSPQAIVKATARVHPKTAPTKSKTQILEMEFDNLANQFADAVTATSPTKSRVKGLELEGFLTTLQGDPFSTRKQLPRTPESLILDVKNSWRKAVEEHKAEKLRRSIRLNDSATGLLTPLVEPQHALGRPAAVSSNPSPTVTSHRSPPAYQQLVSPNSTLSWSAPDSQNCRGSKEDQFSLHHETLPEMASWDSLESLDEEADVKNEEFRKTDVTKSQFTIHQQVCNDGSYMENVRKSKDLLPNANAPGVDKEWLMQSSNSVESNSKVFSLDLDTLDTTSPPKNEYSLPKLITFSPIDDVKC